MAGNKLNDAMGPPEVEMIENHEGQDHETKLDSTAYEHQILSTTPKTRAEKALMLKADLCIVPLAALCYLVSYMDRNNIGNARLMDWQQDISLSDSQYYNVTSLFFVGYILFMFPANILVCFLQPQRMIGGAVVMFGVLVICLSVAKSYGAVLAIRFLTACFQCTVQSLGVYTPFWYQRNELATRSAAYYSAATLSGAFSGLIAYGVQIDLDGVGGRRNWQWLFIIEGALAVGVGIIVILLLPPYPDQIKTSKHWLFSSEEITLAKDRARSYNTLDAKIEVSHIWNTFRDPKTYFFAMLNVGSTLAVSSVGIFLPTFIAAFGFSPVKSQLFSVIPYACAFFCLIAVCSISDRLNIKFVPIICLLSMILLGYILLVAATSTNARIAGTCLVVAGAYPTVVLTVAWIGINTAGFTKRAATWSVAEICSNSFAVMGSHIYTNPPRFIKGHSIVIGFICCSMIAASCAYFYMKVENKKRDKIEEEFRGRAEMHPDMNKTLEQLCDRHIAFRYTL